MSRTRRRSSVNAEAIAPWVALSVILLMWWAGAKMVAWIRPLPAGPVAALGPSDLSRGAKTTRPIDATTPEGRIAAAPRAQEATLTADVSVTYGSFSGYVTIEVGS